MHFTTTALLALLPAALAAPTTSGPLDKRAPIIQARAGTALPGKYIVKLREGVTDETLTKALGKIAKADHVYKGIKFKGFAGKIADSVLNELRDLPEVCVELTNQMMLRTVCF